MLFRSLLPFTKKVVPHIDLVKGTLTLMMPDEIETEEEEKA